MAMENPQKKWEKIYQDTTGEIYDILNKLGKERVDLEIQKFEREAQKLYTKGWSNEEIQNERERIKKEISEEMMKRGLVEEKYAD